MFMMLVVPVRAALPFALQGPGIDPAHFRVTIFASGLNYPVGMVQLADGSILATSSDGPNFFTSNGRLLRLVDADHNGVADGPGTELITGLSGGVTSVRIGGQLVFVTGQNRPIYVLRMGAKPSDPFTQVGRIDITYAAGGWEHPHSALGLRPTPGAAQSYDVFFQIGSKANFAATTQNASFSSTGLGGISGTLRGDSVYMLTFVDHGSSVTATNLAQVLNGVRNPSGFAFHPVTGDLYFEDNGIDGLVDANEPLSADELNVLPASAMGWSGTSPVPFYGFPTTYTEYRTGTSVGRLGVAPLVSFQPQPDPLSGEESEGPNDIAFSPPGFPAELNDGIFVTFHGKFSQGGTSNEENPLVFVRLGTTNYFHITKAKLPGVGHLDGLLPAADSLFVSDIATNGSLAMGAGKGVIYQITALVGPPVRAQWVGTEIELTWKYGVLQQSAEVRSGWADVATTSPYRIAPRDATQRFFRTRNN